MEPQFTGNTTPNFAPEQQPATLASQEQFPDAPPTLEIPIANPEKATSVEQLSIDRAGQTMQPIAIPGPTSTPDPLPSDGQATADNAKATPHVAADNDVIEKEWLDKVKQVISTTSHDPYAQQSEVSKLMADYVLKRFGKKIGESEGQEQ